MKKSILILSLFVAGAVQAATVTLERQASQNTQTNVDTSIYRFAVKNQINKDFSGDISSSFSQNESTNALGQRLEFGLGFKLFPVNYTRVAAGQKFSTSGNNPYYSVETGITTKVSNLSLKAGFRFREAFDTTSWPSQTERTWRVGASYPVLKDTSINLGYDRTFGDSESRAYILSVTRSF